jgi:glutamate/tyrosine decarboxylase-like PLP-dependent enzyme
MVLRHVGRSGVQAVVARHNALARQLAAAIDSDPDFERLAPVALSIVCFRYAPAAIRGDENRLNAVNKAIIEAVQAGGEAFVTNAVLRGRFALRACVLHHATTADDIMAMVELVRRLGARFVNECGESSP